METSDDRDGAVVLDKLGRYVAVCEGCDIPGISGECDIAEAKANAALIAAGPDLLEALEAILPEFEMLYEEFDPDGQLGAWIEWSIMAQNAILKANGSEQ